MFLLARSSLFRDRILGMEGSDRTGQTPPFQRKRHLQSPFYSTRLERVKGVVPPRHGRPLASGNEVERRLSWTTTAWWCTAQP